MRCPRCTVELAQAREGEVDVHACSQCGGVWLHAATAHPILAPLAPGFAGVAATGAPALRCCSCGSGMEIWRNRTDGVEIDVCRPHGIWLDHGELVHLSQALAQQRGVPVPPQQAAYARWGPAAAVGAGAVGLAAVGTAAAIASNDPSQEDRGTDAVGEVLANSGDLVTSAGDVGSFASEATDLGGNALELGGSVLETGASAAEGAFSALGSVFEVLVGLLDF